MTIIEFGAADEELAAGAFEVLRAVHAADTPESNAPHRDLFLRALAHPLPDDEERRFVAVEDGEVVGLLQIQLPTRDNLHFAGAQLAVLPGHRRRGHGTALLERYLAVARAGGRTELALDTHMTWQDGPVRSEAGRAFLEHHGFKLALSNINRRGPVDAMDPDREQQLLDQARAAAGDEYEIVSWLGRTPAELVDTMCRIDSMILSEVPLGDLELEPAVIDPELKEAKAVRNEAVGIVPVTTVARHRASGEVVANTVIGVVDDPEYHDAFQWITIVAPGHRGHRLGTLVKLVNLRLLREQFPQVSAVWTDNADVNSHMIDINAAMGFLPVDATGDFVRKFEA